MNWVCAKTVSRFENGKLHICPARCITSLKKSGKIKLGRKEHNHLPEDNLCKQKVTWNYVVSHKNKL